MFNLFRPCRKNRSTCNIRQCCFDIVAGVDGALVLCFFVTRLALLALMYLGIPAIRHVQTQKAFCATSRYNSPYIIAKYITTETGTWVPVLLPVQGFKIPKNPTTNPCTPVLHTRNGQLVDAAANTICMFL